MLKPVVDKLEDLAAPLREHYTAKDGKFHLALDGEHPAEAKVKEMRTTNIDLMRENGELKTKFADVDPVKVAADRARLVELEAAAPRIAELESSLTKARQQADSLVLESKVTDGFLRSGGIPKAARVVVAAAASVFTVKDGVLTSTQMSPDRPGQSLSLDEYLTLQSREHSYLWGQSSGGGADPKRGGGAGGANVIRNPTPQQLGQHAADVKAGKVRFEYD